MRPRSYFQRRADARGAEVLAKDATVP